MKLIAFTIPIAVVALVAAVAAFAALPAETTHACGQLTVYHTVAEFVAYNNTHGTVHDNGDGTVTINKGSPDHEQTYTPQLGQGDCPSGGDRPAGPLPSRGSSIGSYTTIADVPSQRPTRRSNARSNVQVTSLDTGDERTFAWRVADLFDGDYDTYTAESSDTDVMTVQQHRTCAIIGVTGFVHVDCLRVTVLDIEPETMPVAVCESGFHSGAPSCITYPDATHRHDVYATLPQERHEATVTVTATNSDIGRTATDTMTVMVSVDPNES